MEDGKAKLVSFLKRFSLIIFLAFAVITVCYSCSAINTVSNYNLNLEASIGSVYESKDQNILLIIKSPTEIFLNSEKEEETGIYFVDKKDNVLFLTNEEKMKEHVFLPLSREKIFWHNKNITLYRWEE